FSIAPKPMTVYSIPDSFDLSFFAMPRAALVVAAGARNGYQHRQPTLAYLAPTRGEGSFPVGQRVARSLPERWPARSPAGMAIHRFKAIDSRTGEGQPSRCPFNPSRAPLLRRFVPQLR